MFVFGILSDKIENAKRAIAETYFINFFIINIKTPSK